MDTSLWTAGDWRMIGISIYLVVGLIVLTSVEAHRLSLTNPARSFYQSLMFHPIQYIFKFYLSMIFGPIVAFSIAIEACV
jgi:hypothetical protein